MERGTVKSGRDAQAAVDPAFEHGAFDRVRIDRPAAQEADITVTQAAAGAAFMLLPMVERELD